MNLKIKNHSDLSNYELTQITDLILKGDEVNPETLTDRLSESTLIAFFEDNNKIVATATIKKPLDSYKTKVFTNSKSNLSINDYSFELGYVMVDENCREGKLASRLCRELSKIFLSENLFATTRTDNLRMQSILRKNYYTEIGVQYPTRNNKGFLKLFIKQKLMDTYHINLSKTTWGTETLFSGSVMKLSKPTPGKRNTLSMVESIARNSKAVAIGDVLREAANLDFKNNEIIFIPTFERLTSIAELTQKLNDVAD